MWNEKANLCKFERTGYSMLLPRGLKTYFQVYLDQILSSDINHSRNQAVATRVAKTPPKPVYSASAKGTPEDQEQRSNGRFKKARTLPQAKTSPVGRGKSNTVSYPVTPPEFTRISISAAHHRKLPRKAKLATRAEGSSSLFETTPEPTMSLTRQQQTNRSQKRSARSCIHGPESCHSAKVETVETVEKRFRVCKTCSSFEHRHWNFAKRT
jgi:hypothetical protein